MGRKQYIPYGLYRMEGFVSAPLAKKSGFTVRDLDILCEAFMNMFECDRSAARGLMTSRKLVLFEHESELGNASSRSLFDTVGVKRTTAGVARKFSDYAITIDEAALPAHVTVRTFE
jgi:CRISPR-associated protein Csd2